MIKQSPLADAPMRHVARREPHADRAGTIMVLSAVMMVMMCCIAALCINVAYMELTRSEMRLATDAASKAASITLGQTGDQDLAQVEGLRISSLHLVAGQQLTLDSAAMRFGHASPRDSGSYNFQEGVTPFNAVQVNGSFENRTGGTTPLLAMSGFLGQSSFGMELSSIAARIDNDICLVIDRSGSMAWDLTNDPYSYPGDLHGKSIIQNYFVPPHATDSRWAAIQASISQFLSILESSTYQPRVALVSYSSNFAFGDFQSSVSSLDQALTPNFDLIRSQLSLIGSKPTIGNTNIAAGLRDGINSLSSTSHSRPNASHNIVLMTDGIMTQGDDPVVLAAQALTQNIKVHTVTFSAQADQALMAEVALAGGGKHYHAPNAETLSEIFIELAETLPAMLIQ